MKTIFDKDTRDGIIDRIKTLSPNNTAQWGIMNIYQMLKHCNLAEELYLGNIKHKRMFLGRVYGTNVAALLLFDTGDPSITFLSNQAASPNVTTLPANTQVSLTTNSGFTYQYTTNTTTNITQVLRPSYTGDPRSIYSIGFFIDNQFLMDYQNHRIGLKNN